MKPFLRFFLPVLAGSGLLLLSGCGELYDREGGREYHRHAYVASYPAYDYGPRYHGGYYGGRYAHHPYYGERSSVVVVAPRGPSPYYHSGYRSRAYVAPSTTYYRGRPSSPVVVNVSPKAKKKAYYDH